MARARKPVEFVSTVPADAPAAWAYRSSAAGSRRAVAKPDPAAKSRPAARPRVPSAAPPPPAAVPRERGGALERALVLAFLPFAAIVVMVRSPHR